VLFAKNGLCTDTESRPTDMQQVEGLLTRPTEVDIEPHLRMLKSTATGSDNIPA
jgi:hypothetical protein